jgi:hypothetical protein
MRNRTLRGKELDQAERNRRQGEECVYLNERRDVIQQSGAHGRAPMLGRHTPMHPEFRLNTLQ